MSEFKDKIIKEIIEREGGYVNDPSDSGGATKYGITEYVARENGYQGRMEDLPRFFAYGIYDEKYFKPIWFDEIAEMSRGVSEELADTAINMGTHRAGKFLQKSLNVLNRNGRDYDDLVVDGNIGRKTVTALWEFLKKRGRKGEIVLLRMLNALQGAFYVELAERRVKDERFVFGWYLNRIA